MVYMVGNLLVMVDNLAMVDILIVVDILVVVDNLIKVDNLVKVDILVMEDKLVIMQDNLKEDIIIMDILVKEDSLHKKHNYTLLRWIILLLISWHNWWLSTSFREKLYFQ